MLQRADHRLQPRFDEEARAAGQNEIVQRQLAPELVPITLRRFLPVVERLAGWNLIIKARKAQRS
jgi:hypothetical protein